MITIAPAPADLALDFTGEEMDIAAAWHEFVQGRWPGASPLHFARFQSLPAPARALFADSMRAVDALQEERGMLERQCFVGVFGLGMVPAGYMLHSRIEIDVLLRPLDQPTHDERVAEAVGCTADGAGAATYAPRTSSR